MASVNKWMLLVWLTALMREAKSFPQRVHFIRPSGSSSRWSNLPSQAERSWERFNSRANNGWNYLSWSRLFGLDIDVETKSRHLDLDRNISTVETKILKVSRFSWLSRLTFWQCWDRESRSRHVRDKLSLPGWKTRKTFPPRLKGVESFLIVEQTTMK